MYFFFPSAVFRSHPGSSLHPVVESFSSNVLVSASTTAYHGESNRRVPLSTRIASYGSTRYRTGV